MNGIFNEIYTDQDGNDASLPPLEEAMQYQYEVKQTNTIDGSTVLPYDQMNAEMFYPVRQENVDTTAIVEDMAANKLAPTMLSALCDPKKNLSDYATAVGGKFSWGQTTNEEHMACIGKNATNDPAESPFAQLTRQLQCFGRILGIHASAVGYARIKVTSTVTSRTLKKTVLISN